MQALEPPRSDKKLSYSLSSDSQLRKIAKLSNFRVDSWRRHENRMSATSRHRFCVHLFLRGRTWVFNVSVISPRTEIALGLRSQDSGVQNSIPGAWNTNHEARNLELEEKLHKTREEHQKAYSATKLLITFYRTIN